jgi:DNA-binding MarR family transcriptional regulator
MPVRSNGHALTNGSLHAAETGAVHAALRTVVRQLFGFDDESMPDLPLRQFKVCMALYGESRSMSEIGRELSLSPSAVTQVSDRLERRGLIERVFLDEDRRVRKLRLTAQGQKIVRSREQKQLQRIADVLESLESDELRTAITGLEILARGCTSDSIAKV